MGIKHSTSNLRKTDEKGIALVMVLILSAIALAIMAALIFMLTSGTQVSGGAKRYRTALEAGKAGSDVTFQMIAARGKPDMPDLPNFEIPAEDVGGYDCLIEKLNTSTMQGDGVTLNWSASCSKDMTIDPADASTYDMTFDIGVLPTYTVFSKIVNTVEGNSAGSIGLTTGGVVASNSGEITVMSRPYLYTIELEARNSANPSERAKLSVLYEY